jgi:hypothetical protein
VGDNLTCYGISLHLFLLMECNPSPRAQNVFSRTISLPVLFLCFRSKLLDVNHGTFHSFKPSSTRISILHHVLHLVTGNPYSSLCVSFLVGIATVSHAFRPKISIWVIFDGWLPSTCSYLHLGISLPKKKTSNSSSAFNYFPTFGWYAARGRCIFGLSISFNHGKSYCMTTRPLPFSFYLLFCGGVRALAFPTPSTCSGFHGTPHTCMC